MKNQSDASAVHFDIGEMSKKAKMSKEEVEMESQVKLLANFC